MKRANMRQVVSAVYHLRNERGVYLSDIEEYLRFNYGVLSAPEYKLALKLAVKEGFLKLKNNRFHPMSVSQPTTDLVVTRRRRRIRRRRRGMGRSKQLRMAVDQLMARRRKRSRRRGGRRHEGDNLVTMRRRRRSRRRGRRHEQAQGGDREEEKKENLSGSNESKTQDPASLLIKKEGSSWDGFYFGGN